MCGGAKGGLRGMEIAAAKRAKLIRGDREEYGMRGRPYDPFVHEQFTFKDVDPPFAFHFRTYSCQHHGAGAKPVTVSGPVPRMRDGGKVRSGQQPQVPRTRTLRIAVTTRCRSRCRHLRRKVSVIS